MSLLTFMQNIASFIVGGFGISAITAAIGFMAIGAAFEWVRWSRVAEAIGGGAVLFSSAWIVNTWLV